MKSAYQRDAHALNSSIHNSEDIELITMSIKTLTDLETVANVYLTTRFKTFVCCYLKVTRCHVIDNTGVGSQ